MTEFDKPEPQPTSPPTYSQAEKEPGLIAAVIKDYLGISVRAAIVSGNHMLGDLGRSYVNHLRTLSEK